MASSTPELERFAMFMLAPPKEWLIERVMDWPTPQAGFVSGFDAPENEGLAATRAPVPPALTDDDRMQASGWLFSEAALRRFVGSCHDPELPDRYEGLRYVHGVAHLGHPFLELRREVDGRLDLLFLPHRYLGFTPPPVDEARRQLRAAFESSKGVFNGNTYTGLVQFTQRIPLNLPPLWEVAAEKANELRDLRGWAEDPDLWTDARIGMLRVNAREAATRLLGAAVRLEAALDLLEDFETGYKRSVEAPTRWLNSVGLSVRERGTSAESRPDRTRLLSVVREIQTNASKSTRAAILEVAKRDGWRTTSQGLPDRPYDQLPKHQREAWERAAYNAYSQVLASALRDIQDAYGGLLSPADLARGEADLERLRGLLEQA